MSSLKNFTQIVSNIFNPKPIIPSLGRWSSTIKEYEHSKIWFHDSCNQDNCYVDIFRDISHSNINSTNNTINSSNITISCSNSN